MSYIDKENIIRKLEAVKALLILHCGEDEYDDAWALCQDIIDDLEGVVLVPKEG